MGWGGVNAWPKSQHQRFVLYKGARITGAPVRSWGASGGGSAGFYTQAEAGLWLLMGSEKGLEPMDVWRGPSAGETSWWSGCGGGMMVGLGTKHITLWVSVSSSVTGGWLSAYIVPVKVREANGGKTCPVKSSSRTSECNMPHCCFLVITGVSKPWPYWQLDPDPSPLWAVLCTVGCLASSLASMR